MNDTNDFKEVKVTYENGKYSIPSDLKDCITLNISDEWKVEGEEQTGL